LGAIFSQKSFLWVTLEHLPKKKSKGGVASRNVTKTQYEDFLMSSVAQGYGQYLTNVMVLKKNESSINSTMIRCSPMMLVNLQ
jgi:hypothetical protein